VVHVLSCPPPKPPDFTKNSTDATAYDDTRVTTTADYQDTPTKAAPVDINTMAADYHDTPKKAALAVAQDVTAANAARKDTMKMNNTN